MRTEEEQARDRGNPELSEPCGKSHPCQETGPFRFIFWLGKTPDLAQVAKQGDFIRFSWLSCIHRQPVALHHAGLEQERTQFLAVGLVNLAIGPHLDAIVGPVELD